MHKSYLADLASSAPDELVIMLSSQSGRNRDGLGTTSLMLGGPRVR